MQKSGHRWENFTFVDEMRLLALNSFFVDLSFDLGLHFLLLFAFLKVVDFLFLVCIKMVRKGQFEDVDESGSYQRSERFFDELLLFRVLLLLHLVHQHLEIKTRFSYSGDFALGQKT